MISTDEIQRIAQESRFLPATIEKVLRLAEILNEIRNHPFLSSRLVLKGGTAIHLFHLEGRRLSVDIDLNYIGQIDREKMLEDKPVVQDAIQKLCLALGYRVQRRPTEHAGGKWRLNYVGHNHQPQNLELDVNFLYRVPIWKTELQQISIAKLLGIDCKFTIVSDLELWAGKVSATVTRAEPRDLFDINLVSEKIIQDEDFRSTVILLASASRKDLREIKLIEWDESLEKRFQERLFPVLRSDENLNPKQFVSRAREVIAPFLDFKPKEKEYLDLLIDKGDYQPELIFSEEKIAEKVKLHPVPLWKAFNVREHKGLTDDSFDSPE